MTTKSQRLERVIAALNRMRRAEELRVAQARTELDELRKDESRFVALLDTSFLENTMTVRSALRRLVNVSARLPAAEQKVGEALEAFGEVQRKLAQAGSRHRAAKLLEVREQERAALLEAIDVWGAKHASSVRQGVGAKLPHASSKGNLK